MKSRPLLFVFLLLCVTYACEEPDNNIAEPLLVINNDIISVENNQTNFAIGETVYLDILIENNQTTIDEEILQLTEFTDSEIEESSVSAELKVFKETSLNTLTEIVFSDDDIEVVDGGVLINNTTIESISLYDGTNFTCRFGLTLPGPGTYFISGPFLLFPDKSGTVIFDVGSNDSGALTLGSKIINSNADGAYELTVN